jgi:glycerophosphoryl diester phosphodiesterase
MRKIVLWILVLLPVIISASCERVEYFPDKPVAFTGTRIMAHKGGGSFDRGNTLEACMYGLQLADGIEVDIQKSLDNDLWLSHSSHVESCGSFEETCFASLSSKTIVLIDTCLGNQFDYTQLEQVFAYMSTNYPDKFISLDVKAWAPCDGVGINLIGEMNSLARAIIDLTEKYSMEDQVLVESEVGDFLYYIKKHNARIETYLVALGDFELGVSRALDAGFSGVSFHYKFDEPINKAMVDLMHRKGLKIQLWTVNEPADLEEARSLAPDFIQTDNF